MGVQGGVSPGSVYLGTLAGMTATNRNAQIAAMKTANMVYIRIDSPFNSGNTTVSGPYDAVATAAVSAGMIPVMLLIDNTGTWSNSTTSGSFAYWCGVAAAHYAAMGIHTFEVGNEVNLGGNWSGGTVNPATYAACLVACYGQIKANDSSALVLTTGMAAYGQPLVTGIPATATNYNQNDFFSVIYPTVSGHFDAVSLHPYNYSAFSDGNTNAGYPDEVSNYNPWYVLDALNAMITQPADAGKKIWFTEFGVPTGTDAGYTAYTQAQQATSIDKAFTVANSKAYAGPLFSYSWYDSTTDGDFGLYTASGVAKTALTNFTNDAAPASQGSISGTVTGLTNGTAYTFTVHATNSVGNSAESAPSGSVTPTQKSGTVAGTVTWTGSVSGTAKHSGTVSGHITWTGSTSGHATHAGTTTGAVAWTGAVSGTATHSGSVSGAINWAGAASGQTEHNGEVTGIVAWAGATSGRTAHSGATTGLINWVGAVTGTTPTVGEHSGSVTGHINWAGNVTGQAKHEGGFAAAVAWAGAVSGTAPVVGAKSGTVAGQVAWTGHVSGQAKHQGTLVGGIWWVGAVTGSAPHSGTVSGQVQWVGAVVGTNVMTQPGNAVLTIAPTGTATLALDQTGHAAMTLAATGSAKLTIT